jgi:hypothetical protein
MSPAVFEGVEKCGPPRRELHGLAALGGVREHVWHVDQGRGPCALISD